MKVPATEASITLSIRQKKFRPEGFASTVRAPARPTVECLGVLMQGSEVLGLVTAGNA
jgi:hypothetical protein